MQQDQDWACKGQSSAGRWNNLPDMCQHDAATRKCSNVSIWSHWTQAWMWTNQPAPRNVSQTEVKKTYLRCVNTIRLKRRPKNGIKRLDGLTFESRTHEKHCCWRGRPKFEATNVHIVQEDETAYLECASAAQPHGNISKCACRVIGPRCRCGRIKIIPRNISWAQKVGNTYLGHANMLWSIWSCWKQSKTISNLTFWFRMLGEYWHNVEDHRWSSAHVALSGQVTDTSAMWLPNQAIVLKSCKPSHSTNLTDTIQIRHFHLEHILLDLDKYTHFDTFTILSIYYPVLFMGECWSCKQTIDICLLAYISARVHYLHFVVH